MRKDKKKATKEMIAALMLGTSLSLVGCDGDNSDLYNPKVEEQRLVYGPAPDFNATEEITTKDDKNTESTEFDPSTEEPYDVYGPAPDFDED